MFEKITTDANGNVTYHYQKLSKIDTHTTDENLNNKKLPNTGTSQNNTFAFGAGIMSFLLGLGLVKKRKSDES